MSIWHVTSDYTGFHPGRKADCARCKNRSKKPCPEKPKALSYEEASKLIDRCSCGVPISKDNTTGKCEACLPAWLERIAKLDAQQNKA